MTRVASDRSQPAPGSDRGDSPDPPRDLIDFHLRWREFRPYAEGLLTRSDMSPDEIVTVRALVDLADRVRDDDLN
jgi:hypothetical protein